MYSEPIPSSSTIATPCFEYGVPLAYPLNVYQLNGVLDVLGKLLDEKDLNFLGVVMCFSYFGNCAVYFAVDSKLLLIFFNAFIESLVKRLLFLFLDDDFVLALFSDGDFVLVLLTFVPTPLPLDTLLKFSASFVAF